MRKLFVALLAGSAVSACAQDIDEVDTTYVEALTGRVCAPDDTLVPLPITLEVRGGPPDDPGAIAVLESVLVDCDGIGADTSCAFPRPGCDQLGCCRGEIVRTFELGVDATGCEHGACARLDELEPYEL